MSALSTDTRSIGQVLYETMFPNGDTRTLWVNLRPIQREPYERAAEVIFNRGFKAGIEAQKLADPPPVAKALKKQLGALAAAAREHIEAQKADHVGTRVSAREHLVKLLEGVK
jgi:hypothetical protein